MYRKILLVSVLFLSSASYALKFKHANDSDIAGLKYSYAFDGYHWIDAFGDNSPAILAQHKIDEINIARLPKAWKIEAPDKSKFYCWDQADQQQKFTNVLAMSNLEFFDSFVDKDDLLLDIVAETIGISVRVTDMDGKAAYSNTLICSVE
jgi:hypothetical protein